MTKKKKSILSDQRFIVLLVIIALSAVFSFMSKEFRQYTTILSMLDFSYYDLLMAIGVTFPLITGGVDLSIGTGMVCYALIGGTLVRSNNVPVVVAMLLCVVLGIAIGALNGVLIGIMNLPPFLATLCTCMITRGAGSLCSATPWPTLNQPGGWFHSIFKLTIGQGRSASRYPLGFLWMILLVILMEFVLNHTKFGRYTIAIGSNKEAAALSGINVKFYHVMVYVVCGLFTGLAAIAYAAVTPTVQPGTGDGRNRRCIRWWCCSFRWLWICSRNSGRYFRNHAVKDRSSICRSAGKLAADHHRCCIDRCSIDRYPEREKKCTLITETYRLAYRQSA